MSGVHVNLVLLQIAVLALVNSQRSVALASHVTAHRACKCTLTSECRLASRSKQHDSHAQYKALPGWLLCCVVVLGHSTIQRHARLLIHCYDVRCACEPGFVADRCACICEHSTKV